LRIRSLSGGIWRTPLAVAVLSACWKGFAKARPGLNFVVRQCGP
jgi:hypothetical protein